MDGMKEVGRKLLATGAALLAVVAGGAGVSGGEEGSGLLPGHALLRGEPEAVVETLLQEKLSLLDEPGELVRAYVLFDQPLDRVWELLTQTGRQAEFRSEIEKLVTVAELPDGHVDEHQIRILFVDMSYRLRYRFDPEHWRILWQLDPGSMNRMRRVEGYWELYEMDAEHTLGRFATLVDVGDALPSFVEEAVTRKTLPRTLENCRRWVNSQGGAQ
jgi:hypothetical protein